MYLRLQSRREQAVDNDILCRRVIIEIRHIGSRTDHASAATCTCSSKFYLAAKYRNARNIATMSKRTATELHESDGQAFQKVSSSGIRREANTQDPGMGEFEDAWEDEIESDEEVVDGEKDEEGQFIADINNRNSDVTYLRRHGYR